MSLEEILGTPRYETYYAPKTEPTTTTPTQTYTITRKTTPTPPPPEPVIVEASQEFQEMLRTPEYERSIERFGGTEIETGFRPEPEAIIETQITNIKIDPLKTFTEITDPIKNIENILEGNLGILTMLLGTQEQKVGAVTDILPAQIDAKTITITPEGETEIIETNGDLQELMQTVIEQQKKTSEEMKSYWEGGGIDIQLPEIQIPDLLGGLKDIGKYALIGLAVIVAAIIFTRK